MAYEFIDEFGDEIQIYKFKTKDALIDFIVYMKLGDARWRKI